MQLSLAFTPSDLPGLVGVRQALLRAFGSFSNDRRLEPMDQLVRGMVCGRSEDAASDAAFARLKLRFGFWAALLDAPVEELTGLLGKVSFAAHKAARLKAAFARIKARVGEVTLDGLADMPLDEASDWLRGLEGVGAFATAATLNFSTLRRRVFAVDTHGLRVLQRLGIIGPSVSAEAASQTLLAAAPASWTANDFYELHWLLKRLGQIRCGHSAPRCGGCPMAESCAQKIAASRFIPGSPRPNLPRPVVGASHSFPF